MILKINKQEEVICQKLIIDSKEYEVDPVVKANYDAMQAKLDAAEQRSSNVEKVEGERDALQSQVDNLTKNCKQRRKLFDW